MTFDWRRYFIISRSIEDFGDATLLFHRKDAINKTQKWRRRRNDAGTLLYQKRLKRLFAYSTVAHTGFILLGVVAASPDSVKTLIFYLMVYSALTIILFSLLIFAIISIALFPGYLASWTSSGLKNYVFVMSFSLTLFSIAGIPPLSGFFSKFLILLSFLSQEYLFTSVIIVLISSVACFYYIRLIKTFFFVKSSKNSFWISSAKRQHSEYIIGTLLFFNMFDWNNFESRV